MIDIFNNIKLEIIGFLIYLFIFILPIFLFIKFKEKINPLVALKLTNNPMKNILKGMLFSLTYIALLILKNLLEGWRIVSFNIGIMWISVLLVGFLEEIPFRGFLLKKLMKKVNFIQANIITTFLFVLIHMPQWVLSGNDIIKASFTISIVSLVLGYLYKEYDSLWIPIICHSVFNLTTWIGLK